MLPVIGTYQANLPFDDLPPFIRSRAFVHFRACDGIVGDNIIAPLTRQRMRFPMRSDVATIYTSDGTSIALVKSAPAWSAHAWPSGSERNEVLLVLSDGECIRFVDIDTEQLLVPVRSMSGKHEWIHDGDGPLWSLTNDDASDAYLAADVYAGVLRILHHNGTADAQSVIPGIAVGNCCSMRWQFDAATGRVRCWVQRGTNNEQAGALSTALAPETVWGNGSGVQYRINAFGDDVFGGQHLRTSAVFFNLANRSDLEQLL